MSDDDTDLLTRALDLPVPQWAELARRLLLSLEPPDFDTDPEAVEEAQATEIEARLVAADRGESTLIDVLRDRAVRTRAQQAPSLSRWSCSTLSFPSGDRDGQKHFILSLTNHVVYISSSYIVPSCCRGRAGSALPTGALIHGVIHNH